MKGLLVLALVGAWSTLAVAQDKAESESLFDKAKRNVNEVLESEPVQATKEAGKKVYEKAVGVKTSQDNRGAGHASMFYMPFDTGLFIPMKTGFAGTALINSRWSLELEYLSAAIDLKVSDVKLLEFSEKLILGRARWYPGNSFNLSFGYGIRRYKFGLGEEYLSRALSHELGPIPYFEAENQVAVFGAGNRWQLDNGITLGVDWAELIVTTGQGKLNDGASYMIENDKDRDNVKKALKCLRYCPTFNAFKIHLGYTF